MKTKYFLYARKSTEDEERQVMSIEAQLVELEEYANREKLEITERFILSKSAKKPGREVFNKMVDKINGIQTVLQEILLMADKLFILSI
jgi:DNA invertase Pin-like site-specific DNA recombinase